MALAKNFNNQIMKPATFLHMIKTQIELQKY